MHPRPGHWRRSNALLAAIVAVGLSLFAGQATARPHDVSGIAAPVGSRSTGAPPSQPSQPSQPSMDETYAARAAQANNLASFKGGRGVYIASGTVVVVLLIVLIIILL